MLNNGEDEEKLLQKIVVLYGVLEKFGYPPHRVEECLKAIKTIELEEAMDYVSHPLHGCVVHHCDVCHVLLILLALRSNVVASSLYK